MFQTLINAFKVKDIRKKILMTLFLLLIFRLGCYIPVPGINGSEMNTSIGNNPFLSLLNSVNGGALASGTLFALGITPYINASIIMQLLTIGIPPLNRLQQQGEDGRKKIAQITRIVTVVLAIVQGIGIVFGYRSIVDKSLFNGSAVWLIYIIIVLVLTAGTCLTMWIGERITEYGIGNGISLLIFVGILSSAGTAIIDSFTRISVGGEEGTMQVWILLGFLATVVVVFGLIVFVDLAERKINVQYAKQIKGRKMYGGQSTHIPIKVNSSGVMPLIFAFALLSFPQLITSMAAPESGFAVWWAQYLGAGSWAYAVVLSVLILFFAFFYGQIQFNPEDVSRNIQQYGGFIPGIRPGKPTTDYLKKINNRITLFGAIFLAFIALVPSLVFKGIVGDGSSLLNAFSTTGLLIVVSVALE